MTLIWPSVLVPRSENWRRTSASMSGGRTPTGQSQVVAGPGSFWLATLTIPVHRDEQILAFRALRDGLDGRAGTVWVGPREGARIPWPVDAWGRRVTPALRRRPQLDGTPFADPPTLAEDLITARLVGAAALNATELTIQVDQTVMLKPGQYFGIGERLHLITAVSGDNLTFRPWLRSDYPDGEPIRLVKPICKMRFARDDGGDLDLDLGRFSTLTIDLEEAF